MSISKLKSSTSSCATTTDPNSVVSFGNHTKFNNLDISNTFPFRLLLILPFYSFKKCPLHLQFTDKFFKVHTTSVSSVAPRCAIGMSRTELCAVVEVPKVPQKLPRSWDESLVVNSCTGPAWWWSEMWPCNDQCRFIICERRVRGESVWFLTILHRMTGIMSIPWITQLTTLHDQ